MSPKTTNHFRASHSPFWNPVNPFILGAAEKLKKRKGPNGSHMGFLRQRPDGTTSLNIITGESGVIPGTEKDRPVLLGSLLGKVKQGTGSIQVNMWSKTNKLYSHFLPLIYMSKITYHLWWFLLFRDFAKTDEMYLNLYILCIMVHIAHTDQLTTQHFLI